jgi:uncharacterized protein YecE (DUF72 family)
MNRYHGMFRVGTSGFHYEHWKGIFYPEDLPKSRWFSHYVRNFDTVELNNTFYRLPSASTFDAWKEQAPKNFCYALELVENADIMIETTHRSDAQRIYHRGFGQDEVAFQLSGRRATQYEEQIVAFGQRSVKRLCA